MGEAKRRKTAKPTTAYHHTSILRDNFIWMSGVIEVEGKGERPVHPIIGDIEHSAPFRREMQDFPPVAWFTTELTTPKCLRVAKFGGVHKETGKFIEYPENDEELVEAFVLDRFVLGFDIKSAELTPWPEYYGYNTAEGNSLNESARSYGDNPDNWYISEKPVNLDHLTSAWLPRDGEKHIFKRNDDFLKSIREIVAICRSIPNVYIPPTWASPDQIKNFSEKLKVPYGRAHEFLQGKKSVEEL